MKTTSGRSLAFPAAMTATYVLFLATIAYVWRFSYFSLDDFNNIYWIQKQSALDMLNHVVNPASDFFRPVGMSAYWLMWHAFGLDPLPYHVVAWTLHALNLVLLLVLLKRFVKSSFAAAIGSMLFLLRANFAEIYWSFGYIFELLACLLMLLVLLIHTRERRSYASCIFVILLTVLAIKSKEMAITLPAVLLAYDLTQKRKWDSKATFLFLSLVVTAGWFTYLKISTMSGTSRDHPYYMDLTFITLGRGYGWYFDRLFDLRLRWGAWMIVSAVAFFATLYRRDKRGLFFLSYIFISLLPVVFLVNHRGDFYWYIPFFGVAGLAALIVERMARRVRPWFSEPVGVAVGLAVFLTVASMHYFRESREWIDAIGPRRLLSEEYAKFVLQLRDLPAPPNGETLHYRFFPTHFSPDTLLSLTQVALRRNDVRVEVVQTFPPTCLYCLDYRGMVLERTVN